MGFLPQHLESAMKLKLIVTAAVLMGVLASWSAVAAPLPPGTSDRLFLTDFAGNFLPGQEVIFAEGGTQTFGGGFCLGCTNVNVLLLEPNGIISDIYTFNGQFNWTSEVEGGPLLQAPTNGFQTFQFQETAEPLEITRAMGGPTDVRLFIQSDAEVPEPASLALLGLGLFAMVVTGRRRCTS
jgi:PEP-CTERM motif